MSNIMLTPFTEQMARSFGSSVASTEFASDLLQAINASINDINQRADTETQIERVANLTTSVVLDVRHQNMLTLGCVYWLATFGRRPRGADVKNLPPLTQLRDEFGDAISLYQADLRNDIDPEEDDDDVVGLGVCEN